MQVLFWGESLVAGNTLDNWKTLALEMQISEETFLPFPSLSFFFFKTTLGKKVEISAIVANVMTVSQTSSPSQSRYPTEINSRALAIL